MAAFYNTATLSYRDTSTNSNTVEGQLVKVLSAEKNAVLPTYGSNDTVTYVISIRNSGSVAYTGLTITDDLGEYDFGEQTRVPLTYVEGSVRYYSNGTLQTAPTVTGGAPLVISGITVPAGGSALLLYEAQTNGYAPPAAGSTITNTAQITGEGVTPLTAQATVTAGETLRLTISKCMSPTSVVENGTVTYTFYLQNSGNTATADSDFVVVTDTFNPVLSGLTVTLNGTPLASGTGYTYNAATGEFATRTGAISVPAATMTQDSETGQWRVTPGVAKLVVTAKLRLAPVRHRRTAAPPPAQPRRLRKKRRDHPPAVSPFYIICFPVSRGSLPLPAVLPLGTAVRAPAPHRVPV